MKNIINIIIIFLITSNSHSNENLNNQIFKKFKMFSLSRSDSPGLQLRICFDHKKCCKR